MTTTNCGLKFVNQRLQPCKNRLHPASSHGRRRFCFYYLLLQQIVIRKVVDPHGLADIGEGGGGGLFGHGAALLQDLHDFRQALLPLLAAGADGLQFGLHDGVQELLDLHIAQAAALIMRLELVEVLVLRQELGEVLRAAERIQIGEDGVALHLAGVLHPQMAGVGVHGHDLLLDVLRFIGQVDAVAQRLAHLGLAVNARQAQAGVVGRQQDLRLGQRLAVDGVELVDDLAALLDTNTSEPRPEPDNEFKLFQNALDFADLRVRDCMVPRVDVEAVDIDDTSIGQLTARFVDSKYSRIFVWRKSIDNIVGYVNSKSLFTRPANIADVMMQVNFVPETMPLQLMLQNFIKHRSNIAVVIDEFGGTAGVISLEDVLEQIFGEIEDEHDIPDLTEKQVGQDEYVLSCRLEVKYLNEKYGLGIEESKEYDTLAGFIIFNYDGIPTAGETVFIGGLQLRILRTTRSRIELARVKKL